MVLGTLDRTPANLAISITGVLGPKKDEDNNPVGLVYFATAWRGQLPKITKCNFGDISHEQVLEKVIYRALELLQTESSAGDGSNFSGYV